MNPFLEHLAARSLEALPVLQPRRASRFEPTEAPGATEVSGEAEAGRTPRDGDPPVPLQEKVRSAPAPVAPEAAGPPASRPDPDRGEPALSPRPEPRPFDTGPAATVPQEATPHLVPGPTILLQPIHRRASAPGPGPRPSTLEPRRSEAPPLLVAAPPATFLTDRMMPPPPASATPTLPAAPERREDIHISIGRIEIRALPPGTSRSRPARDVGPSRLDAYLQQRAGGRSS